MENNDSRAFSFLMVETFLQKSLSWALFNDLVITRIEKGALLRAEILVLYKEVTI